MDRLYIYERSDWPNFRWSSEELSAELASVRHRQGALVGRMSALGFPLRQEAVFRTLVQDVQKSSEIEGEKLDEGQVRSSIARRLGMDIGGLLPADRTVEGVVEMTLDATQNHEGPLTQERLFSWHSSLFPAEIAATRRLAVGSWRSDASGPMQVVSGPAGRERVHYQAPDATILPREMERYLSWFNQPPSADPVVGAGLAHLWFVTIHPFDDGNGRIARAIADLVLARSEGSSQRFYSMSSQIRKERNAYYDALENAQKATLDVTSWLRWFVGCLGRAIGDAETALGSVLSKATFWSKHGSSSFNDRQRTMLNKLMDDFEGKLTSSKWAKMAKCSQDTASRDIADLVERGILRKDDAGGRSTSYSFARDR
jgi:Fic family protein